MSSFTFSRTPQLHFGDDSLAGLPAYLTDHGWARVVLVAGQSFINDPDIGREFLTQLHGATTDLQVRLYDQLPDSDAQVAERFREASPVVVNAIVAATDPPDVVVAIGGGSALDTGKAVSAAYCEDKPIENYLEGVGTLVPSGRRLPLVAVPTTAGTGSEATKNAVLSVPGPTGYKKSLRHDNYVPDLAVIDPLIQLGCPRDVTAASGLDAITQLLEAYMSTGASPFSDALALDGLAAAGRGFLPAVERGREDAVARGQMAYAAYLSGVCLANAGLGVVHGLAGPLGATSTVPHGVACGLLLIPAVETMAASARRSRDQLGILARLAAAGDALTGRTSGSLDQRVDALMARLRHFAEVASLPGLGSFEIGTEQIATIAAAGSNKNSPYGFTENERQELLHRCL